MVKKQRTWPRNSACAHCLCSNLNNYGKMHGMHSKQEKSSFIYIAILLNLITIYG